MTPVVLLELPRSWGKTVLQRLGDGRTAQLELRAFNREGRSLGGIAVQATELPQLIAELTHERNTLLGHPKHASKA